MSPHFLDGILAPKRVAVFGASDEPGTLGAGAVRQPAGRILRWRAVRDQPQARHGAGSDRLPRSGRPARAGGYRPDRDAGAHGARHSPPVRPAWGARGRGAFGGLPRDRRGGAWPGARNTRDCAQVRNAHCRPQLPGRDAARRQFQRDLQQQPGAAGQHRAGLAVGRDLYCGAGLGREPANRIFDGGIGRQCRRCPLRRRTGLSGAGPQDAQHPAVCRGGS